MERSIYHFIVSNTENQNGLQIGLRLADGSFYPVFEEGFKGRKMLILTTVRDDQESVQIDLYKGRNTAILKDLYIGSLVIENVEPALKGEAEIELSIGVDTNGNLNATAVDKKSGERQTLSVSMTSLKEQNAYDTPDFDIDESSPMTVNEESPQTVTEEEPEEIVPEKKKGGILKWILIVLLGLIVLGGIGFGVLYLIQYLQNQPKTTTTQAATASPKPAATPAPAQKDTAAQTGSDKGTWYTVVRGDTLWDISRQFYRDPFLWKRIHESPQNKIPNPDLIFEKQRIFIPEK
ncbi:MAG: LysM peptidoglycan-binding domain-containing protein [Spirochaetaceae bacterium]|nr:MAG: LysM peptidoglycan-binding domain-containing protein [Spirochaetaceae bacterium]